MVRLPGERRGGNAESDRRARGDSTQTHEIVPTARLLFGHAGAKRIPAKTGSTPQSVPHPAGTEPAIPGPAWTGHACTRPGTLEDTPRPVTAMRAAHSHSPTAAAPPPAHERRPAPQSPHPRLRRPPRGMVLTVSRLPHAAKTYRLLWSYRGRFAAGAFRRCRSRAKSGPRSSCWSCPRRCRRHRSRGVSCGQVPAVRP
jgi:hypothetical protein